MKVSTQVARRIREILDNKQMSLYKLEKLSGLSEVTYNSLIYEKYKSVNLSTLITIIRTLGVSLSEFFDSPLFDDESLD